nr:putative ribonuclease H-like domain-containing protein [Tanacetum cinerariifolium]
MTDYALWEVILNGDSTPPTRSVDGVETTYPPTTAEEKLAMKNELKARGTLLMALPNEYQLKFNSYKSAKSLLESIEKRFGGNKESKKIQKTLLKQQYKNFNGTSSERLDQIYDRLQKLISQLEIHGETISQEDLNMKLLRSMPSEWKTHTLIWRNKQNLETLSMDDLYNNLKIYEAEVMSQSNSSQLDNEDLKKIDLDDLKEMDLKWQMAMLTMRSRRFLQKTRRNLGVKGTETIGFDKTKVDAIIATEEAADGPTNFALMAYIFSSSLSSDSKVSSCSKACLKSYETLKEHYDNLTKYFNKSQLNLDAYKAGLESLEARLEVYKKNEAVFKEDIKILKLDVMFRDKAITKLRQKFEKAEKERDDLTLTLEKFEGSSKNLSRLLDSQKCDKFKTGLGYDSQGFDSQVLKNQVNDKYNTCEGYHAVPPPYTGNFKPPKPYLVFADEHVVSESVTSLLGIEKSKVKTSESKLKTFREPIIEDWVSDSKDEIKIETETKMIKPSFAKGNPQQELQEMGVIYSGCSRYITQNMSYLSEYEEIDGGYVAFGGDPKGGKITGKGKISTGKLDFKDVYFVKELKFNLFSVSQMCDKKNSVLFTDTEYVVLSPNFKLLDESQVLLRVPRKNNMYSVDLRNVVPLGGLNFLFAKTTLDESNHWHRRLGHINFKTMNKLVRGNLVRGLPSKIFENNHTCVACQIGKQHKASCKTKTSIMKKMYYLVVTDDYSRFSWVFFLANKDETSRILKAFITGIGNLIDHKVKIIRCDNGTKFKNKEMNQFCEIKGIRREFSVARTPQQNGFVKRKNRTLIEAARIMLADSKLPITFWSKAVNIACYVQNRVLVIKPHNKTPYELFLGEKPALSFMRPFGCPVTILNTLDHLGKFDGKADEGFFVGYSTHGKAFKVFNIRTKIVKENLHITFLENKPNVVGIGPNWLFDIDTLTMSMNYQPVFAGNQTNGNAGPKSSDDEVADDARKKSPEVPRKENEVQDPAKEGDKNSQEKDEEKEHKRMSCMSGQDKDANDNRMFTPVSAAGSTYVYLGGSIPVNAATLLNADLPTDPLMLDLEDSVDTGIFNGAYNDEVEGRHVIRTKWVYRNKKDERGIVIRNKQDWLHKVTPKKKALIMMRFLLLLLGLKQSEEEVYVCQPPGFEDPHFPNKVYKVEKALYGLHQAPRAWYETSSTYLLENIFRRGIIGNTLFIKKDKGDILFNAQEVPDEFYEGAHFLLRVASHAKNNGILISQDKYMADILKKFNFSLVKTASTLIETSKALLKDKEAMDVDVHLYRSMIGSLRYLPASRPNIMFVVCACARFQVTPKVSHLHAVKRIFRYLKGQPKLGLWYLWDSSFDLEAFSDSDYVGASLDRKSTTGGGQFLGKRLISWQCKNQTVVANSTSEADLCIQQYWDSAKVKTVNEDVHIRALIDGKKIIVTEASIRRDLQLQDTEGTACLPNDTIFEELTRMGTMASAIICLSNNQKFIFSKYIFDNMVKNMEAGGSSKRYSSMIQMLQHIDREDLETLWKLVKGKYRNTRPEEGYERVLWEDLKVMFELDIEINAACDQLVLLVTTVFNKVNAASFKVTTADRVTTVGWIKTEMA